ncbi:rCG51520 [Rattus norvegicus]|uniref:RCG51520 n=1 Tax=Rattus norvegicus TaxID=10116 RepID=A6IZ37_RAT|nr:rCG51520 [Rattus norvegicus]
MEQGEKEIGIKV